MKLKKLTATFGKLDRETLTLHDGLNVITRPNEAGKSTWSAFVSALFYGIDTAERSKGGSLPAKTKFKPWSGAAMAGSAELEVGGKAITIERGPAGRTPMGAFSARETESGQPVAGLSADNCGLQLLGAERSVFERSALIRQASLAVSSDSALERRLQSLVTTGEEDVSYSLVEKKLRDLKNRRKHNKTGLIPNCEHALADVESRLSALRACNQQNAQLLQRRQALTERREALTAQQSAVELQELVQKRQTLLQAEADARSAQASAAEAARRIEHLPSEAELRSLEYEITRLAQSEPSAFVDSAPEKPAAPAPFAGLDPDAAQRQAEADCADYDSRLHDRLRYQRRKMLSILTVGILAVVLLLTAVLFVWNDAKNALVMLSCAAFIAVFSLCMNARWKKSNALDEALLQKYGARSRDDILRLANAYREDCARFSQLLAQHQAKAADADAQLSAYREAVQAALLRCAAIAPVRTLSDCRSVIAQALAQHAAADAESRNAESRSAQYQAIRTALGELPEVLPEAVSADPLPSAQAIASQLRAVNDELANVQSQLDLNRGRVLSLGDPATLEAEREQLASRLELLNRQYSALETALRALEKANADLQTRFSPQLNAEAARIMAQLTGGRYEKVLLDSSLSISAKTTDDVLTRELGYLSGGTADQLYLAVRLAIAHLTLPEGTPLILDDALVMFDDERLDAAMHLLREEAKTRQILLFTCQRREQDWLDANA